MINGYSENNLHIITAFLRGKGLNEYAVFGLVANLYAESNLRADNLQNSYETKLGMSDVEYMAKVDSGEYRAFATDKAGYGLCQWTSSGRKAALYNYVKQRGKSIGDINAQLEYLWAELTGSYKKSVLNVLLKAKSVDEAARVVMLKFERPANQSEANQLVRVGYGLEFYEKYTMREVKYMSNIKAYSKKKNGNEKIAANFKVKEFACKDGSDPIFIDEELVEITQKIRNNFGKAVKINSGFRTASYNKKVGGATYSQHLYGKAVDIRVTGVKPKEVAAYAETLLVNRGGIGIYSNFTHIDVRKEKARWNG